jgi:glucosylceramidase
MQHFTLERDRKAVIPYVKAALALNPKLHLWGSPWSPPAWMKYNNALDNGPVRYNDTDPDREAEMVKLNKIKDDDKVLQAHALYLARFVEEYAKEGISVEAVFPQNEPGFHANHYPSCGWETSLYVRYLRDYLGPTFETRKVPAQIWAGTFSSDLSSVRDGWIDDIVTGKAVAADPGAMKYVKGFGLQWNTEEVIEDAKAHQLPILQTEHKSGNYPWVKKPENCIYRHCSLFDPLKAQNDHAYAQQSWDLIRQWITWGVNGYVAWNMVLDTVGQGIDMSRPWPQDSLLVVDRDAKTLIITPAYYVFRHVSGFVDEGARVINLVNVPSDTDALAFKNPDGSIVAVLYNDGNAREVPVALGNQIFKVPLPAEGWATVYYKP